MNINEFKILALRTYEDLDSKLLSSIHMTLGMGSEFLNEVFEALGKNDMVNLAEELGDIEWFACCYSTIHGIDLPDQFSTVGLTDDEELLLSKSIGVLQDIDKDELVYKKVISGNDPLRVSSLHDVFKLTLAISESYGIDMKDARKKVIEKLKLRYPDKFDAEKAVNRDKKAEREILEA